MESHVKSLILVSIISALFLSLPAPTNANNGAQKLPLQTLRLIMDVCKKSDNYNSCLVVLRSNPQIKSATDVTSLARIALQAVTKKSGSVLAFLGLTLKSHPLASQPLRSCISYFEETKRELTIHEGDLEEGLASYDVHTALDSVKSCEDALATARINIPAVGNRIRKWKVLFSAALVAVEMAEG